MAAELVIIELLGKVKGCPIRYTVGAATAIAKGTLCIVTDPRTVAAHSGANQPIVGVAAMEHDVTSGSTSMSVYTNGIFDVTAAAAGVTAIGRICAGSGTANMITAAAGGDLLNGAVVGQCLEAHANDEVGAVRILK